MASSALAYPRSTGGGGFLRLLLLGIVALVLVVPLIIAYPSYEMQSFGNVLFASNQTSWQHTDWPEGFEPPEPPSFCRERGWTCLVRLFKGGDGYYQVKLVRRFLGVEFTIASGEFMVATWDDLGYALQGQAWFSYFTTAVELRGLGLGNWIVHVSDQLMAALSPGTPHLFVDSAGWGQAMASNAEGWGYLVQWLNETSFYYVPVGP